MLSELKTVLLTGGAGFIGSHCIIELAEHNLEPIVVDNLYNSTYECIRRAEKIIGKKIPFYDNDIADFNAMDTIFKKHKIYAVIHFAGYKSVGISVSKPLQYYSNNVCGTINLLKVMEANNCFNIVFSGSSTVYGNAKYLPLNENYQVAACTIASPYGRSKYMIENILRDLCKSDSRWNAIVLRYFNPVGAHKSGLIGEDPIIKPDGQPPNLMPYLSQVAIGRLPFAKVLGTDYNTPDGTGVRSYTHISDIANGHSLAAKKLEENPGFKIYNLGSGIQISVLEMIKAMEVASGKPIPYKTFPRRIGDVAIMDADSTLAGKELGWKATRKVEDMCADLWRYQSLNPNGYSTPFENIPEFKDYQE